MSIPKPPIELDGHCSAIYNDTLYVLSSGGFQSLPIRKHAEWSKEPGGVAVKDPACVQTGTGSDAALYVIGGDTDSDDFSGLQRYTFASKKWETLTSASQNVIQQRTAHSAAYLESSQSILVYAGSQPHAPAKYSSQTFLISTQSPYNIQSFTSNAPPANLPILVPWSSDSAIMLGGATGNTQIYSFSAAAGWNAYETNLTSSPPSSARGMVVDGSDGSKVLELYDFSVSPNTVSSIVLLDADGNPAATGKTVGGSGRSSSTKQKRALTLNDWPKYNSTSAPTAIRQDYSIAMNTGGVAVVSGGNNAAPLALFDQDENSWVDADQFFSSKNQQPLSPSSVSGSTSTPSPTTSTPSSSTAAPPLLSGASHARTMRTLGIILGVLFGIAAVFILILLYLRHRKLQQRKKHGYVDEKTGEQRMSFQDRGASFMKEAGGSANELHPPNAGYANGDGSHTSLNIIAGKVGNRNTTNLESRASFDSVARLVKSRNGETGEPLEMMDIGEKRGAADAEVDSEIPATAQYGSYLTADQGARERKKRSSGWSKYFATSGPTGPYGLSHIPAAYLKDQSTSTGSVYTNDPRASDAPGQTALVTSADRDFANTKSKTLDGQRLSMVASGSPSFNDSREDLARNGSTPNLTEGQTGLIVDPRRPRSQSESVSSYNRSTLSSAITSDYYNDSAHTNWTPTSPTYGKDVTASRPTSSMYSMSVHEPRLPSRGKSGFFPGPGTTYRPPKKSKMSGTTTPTSGKFPYSIKNSTAQRESGDDLEPVMTEFPPVPSAQDPLGRSKDLETDKKQPMSTDLTWLNLDLNGQQRA